MSGESGYSNIDTKTAMKYSAVFACCRVLGETFAAMPAMEYRKNANGDREATRDTAAFDILHNAPNDEMSPFNFKEACMMNANLGGNVVCEKLVNRFGDLVGLYPYQWQMVDIGRNTETKKLAYTVMSGATQKTLKREQVFHVPGISFDGIIGLSPIEYAASAIRLGMSYEQFGVNFYKNGANSSGAFTFPGELGEESFQRLKKDLKENYAGLRNAGTPMLLEGGGKFEQFAMKPADAQLIENKRFQVEDIARMYRVPLHLVGDLMRSTNNNIEHQSLEFVMYTMLPWFKRWEENINMQLLTLEERRAGYYIEFNVAGLLRGDAKSRAEAYGHGRQWGWLSVNDIRKLENMPAIANGNIYMQPSNMIEAGKEVQNADKVKSLAEDIYKMIIEKG
jgi:HK97 family phage portal protein